MTEHVMTNAEIEAEQEAARWGNLYYKGSTHALQAEEQLKAIGLSKPQIDKVIKALATGKFEDKVMTAFDAVMEEDTAEKNTHK